MKQSVARIILPVAVFDVSLFSLNAGDARHLSVSSSSSSRFRSRAWKECSSRSSYVLFHLSRPSHKLD